MVQRLLVQYFAFVGRMMIDGHEQEAVKCSRETEAAFLKSRDELALK